MAIPNPIEGAHKAVKKVPPKVAIIAVGGGIIIYIVFRSHKANTDPAATVDTASAGDAVSSESSPSSGLPGVYPVGTGAGAASLPAVDFSSDGIDGLPAVDDTAVGDGGSLGTLNIVVGTAPDGGSGSDKTPGPAVKSNGKKTVSSRKIKTLADLPMADRKKISEERKNGNVDRYGRTPTERRAARENAGIASQLRQRLTRQRAHKAAGGPPKREHPSKAHGNPKRPIKRPAPVSHSHQTQQSHPKSQPNPPRQKKKSRHRRR